MFNPHNNALWIRKRKDLLAMACRMCILQSMIRFYLSLYVWAIMFSCSFIARAEETVSPTVLPELQIVGGPYLQAPSPTSMTIVWTTNRKCVSKVEYGLSPEKMSNIEASAHHGLIDANTTLHKITLASCGRERPITIACFRPKSSSLNPIKSATDGM